VIDEDVVVAGGVRQYADARTNGIADGGDDVDPELLARWEICPPR